MTKVKSTDYIQFGQDNVVIAVDEAHQFQFCKRCKTGEHFLRLVAHLAPDLDLSGFKRQSLVYLEYHYYNRFMKGISKRYLQRELQELVAEVKKRLKHIKKGK